MRSDATRPRGRESTGSLPSNRKPGSHHPSRRNRPAVPADTSRISEIARYTTKPNLGLCRRDPFLGPNSTRLDPKNDVIFQLLFAAEKNRGLLIKPLTAVLKPASPISQVQVLNPEIEVSDWNDKHAVLDILVRFEEGSHADVEMQSRPHSAIKERLVFYWAKVYAGQLGSGDPHAELKPVIGIYFLDFSCLPAERHHSCYHINEDHEGFPLTDALELHFLELPKNAALHSQPGSQNSSNGDSSNQLAYWCLFLTAHSDEQLEILAMSNPDIRDATNALDALSAGPKTRELAEDRILWEWACQKDLDHERADGLRDGLLAAVRSVCSVIG